MCIRDSVGHLLRVVRVGREQVTHACHAIGVLHAFGRLMAHHARWFLVGWLVIVAVGFAAVGGLLGNQALFSRLKAGDAPQVPGDARTGQQLLDQTATTGSSVELLLERVQPASGTVRAAVASTAAAVAAMPHVAAVQQPYAVAAVTASTTSGTSRTSRSGPAPRTAPASTITSTACTPRA